MRVDLHVPYHQKDLVKSKGARWDPEKRTWYVIDPLDLRQFAPWMGEEVKDWYSGKRKTEKKKTEKAQKATPKKSKGKETGPRIFKSLCGCNVLPWEDCEHTEMEIRREMAKILGMEQLPF